MATYTYTDPVRLAKLHDELLAAGITPSFLGLENGTVTVRVPDQVTEAAVAAVVAAHDPDTPSAAETRETTFEGYRQALRDEYQAIKAGAANARTLLGTDAEWSALTAAQRETRTRQILLGLVNHMENVADALRALVR